ncbi:MAG: protoglobin domain-containing protein [Ignavibacteria bacterium]
METKNIKGYTYGDPTLEKSPVSLEELSLLKKTLLWTEDDDKYLRMTGELLKDQIDDILDLWYGYVGSNDHLLYYFTRDGQPDSNYLSAVRARFGQWILDLTTRPYDQNWLDYQFEIAKRHHSTKKNQTDGVSSVPIVNFRYMVAFIYPITVTIRQFLEKKNSLPKDLDGMYNAWFKAITLTVILWCYPYVNKNEF